MDARATWVSSARRRAEELGQSDGCSHRPRFVDRFGVLPVRCRVVNPAPTDLHVGLAVLQQRGADGDAAVQVAVEAEIADTTAVWPAGRPFQLGNDLHRPDLGCATEG